MVNQSYISWGQAISTINSDGTIEGTVRCPPGQIMLGGGVSISEIQSAKGKSHIMASRPMQDTTGYYWDAQALVDNGVNGGVTLQPYVVCGGGPSQ